MALKTAGDVSFVSFAANANIIPPGWKTFILRRSLNRVVNSWGTENSLNHMEEGGRIARHSIDSKTTCTAKLGCVTSISVKIMPGKPEIVTWSACPKPTRLLPQLIALVIARCIVSLSWVNCGWVFMGDTYYISQFVRTQHASYTSAVYKLGQLLKLEAI